MKPKQHLEFVNVDLATGWEVPPGYPPGFYQKILRATARLEPPGARPYEVQLAWHLAR